MYMGKVCIELFTFQQLGKSNVIWAFNLDMETGLGE